MSYVGDILSFYLDYQANECFIDTASEYNNVLRLGKQYGYKFNQNQVSYGTISLYVLIPAQLSGTGPDTNYFPVIRKGTTFSSVNGGIFTLNEDVDFSDSKAEIIVASTTSDGTSPTFYAIKSKGRIASGTLKRKEIKVGNFKKFFKAIIDDPELIEVVSVLDAQGNEYYEVEHLSQNLIYFPVKNRGQDKTIVPFILKPVIVPRRFVVERPDLNNTIVQFGHGTESNISQPSLTEPNQLVMEMHGKDYITDTSFDPFKLVSNDKFGVGPSNTTLTIVYRANTSLSSNSGVNTINQVINAGFDFDESIALSNINKQTVIDSLEVTNEDRILGDTAPPTSEEIKLLMKGTHAAQNRAVTRQDYISLVYGMPGIFGSVKRCAIMRDPTSFKRNANLYVISESKDGDLIETSNAIKQNIKVWLNGFRMINDTIDILNAKIINFAIDFKVISQEGTNKAGVLNSCIAAIKTLFTRKFEIGEGISIAGLYQILNSVPGVVDTIDVVLEERIGANYSDAGFNVDQNTTPDGSFLSAPFDCVLELKDANKDIRGKVL